MARDLRSETEFGLPSLPLLPAADGKPNAMGIPALTDADALAAGATGQDSPAGGSPDAIAHELRAIYAIGEGKVGPGKVGNADLLP